MKLDWIVDGAEFTGAAVWKISLDIYPHELAEASGAQK